MAPIKIGNAAEVAESLKGILKMDDFTALLRAVDNSPNFITGSMDNIFSDFLSKNTIGLPKKVDDLRGLAKSVYVPTGGRRGSVTQDQILNRQQKAQINTALDNDLGNEADIDKISETKLKKVKEEIETLTREKNPEYFDKNHKFIPTEERAFRNSWVQSIDNNTGGIMGWIRNNKILSAVIIGGVTVGSIMINAHLKAEEINKKSYNITSIEINKDDPEKTTIIFDPQGDAIVPGDEIYIQESNSIPEIDGLQKPVKFNVSGITEIKKKINTNGTFGILKIKTSMQNRAKDTAEQIGKGVGAAAGGLTGGVLNELFKSIGLGGIGDVGMYISIGLLVCCLSVCLLASVILVMRYGD